MKHNRFTTSNSRSAILASTAIAPIAASLLFASVSASAATLVPANFYDCKGREVTVRYSPNRGNGEPSIVMTLGSEVIKASGLNIRTQPTMLGSLVTVQHGSVPDSHSDSLTLLAPDVNVSALPNKLPVEFMTLFFSTRTFTTIGGPSLVPGVIQESSSQPLACKASAPSSLPTE